MVMKTSRLECKIEVENLKTHSSFKNRGLDRATYAFPARDAVFCWPITATHIRSAKHSLHQNEAGNAAPKVG